jgi:hypothetical protein
MATVGGRSFGAPPLHRLDRRAVTDGIAFPRLSRRDYRRPGWRREVQDHLGRIGVVLRVEVQSAAASPSEVQAAGIDQPDRS